MEEYHLRIRNIVESDGTGLVPSLAVQDHTYYGIALMAAVAGHGRLSGAYWRVVQMDEGSGLVRNDLRMNLMIVRHMGEENMKLRQAMKDSQEANEDLGRQHDTQTIATTGEDQVLSDMKPRHSLEMRQCNPGLLSGDDEPPKEEITAIICSYIQPEIGVQLQGLEEDDKPSEKAKNEYATSGALEWPLVKVLIKVWRLLKHLCGLPESMKLVDPEQV